MSQPSRPGNPPVSDEVLAIITDDGSNQPTASRHVEHGEYDTTSLQPLAYANAVHRDWIAHWSRWAWAGKHIKKGDRVLEPGCGREAMLARHLRTISASVPEIYVGVDLDKITYDKEGRRQGSYPWAVFHHPFNFVTQQDELSDLYGDNTFDKIVSFEVYEHITPQLGIEYLDACRRFLAPGGRLLLSTPVFNGKKAANHIREYTTDELRAIIEDRGFKILDRFGTFASYHDVKKGIKELYPDEAEAILKVYERVREFNSDALLAGMLAPLVPDHSRNNVWLCELA